MQLQSLFSTRALRGAVVATACAALTLTAPPAGASAFSPVDFASVRVAPHRKIGPVRNLAAAITKPSSYRVHATWDVLTAATSYHVSLIRVTNGVVLESSTVTDNQWVVFTTLPVGSRVRVKVVPYDRTRRGRPARITRVLPDLTAPTGSYTVTHAVDSLDATVTQVAIQDDLSTDANIARKINWGEGAGFEAWASGPTTVMHTYPTGQVVYYPSVRLTDEAGNTVTLLLDAVSIGDVENPQGTFSAAPGTAWATFTRVRLTQLTLSDDVSSPDNIVRTVNWHDGSALRVWTTGTGISHVYATAGSYTPTVMLEDEAHRSNDVSTSAVVVSRDTVKPRASLTKPRVRRASVRSWIRLHGKASDTAGSGVRSVRVRVIEKRHGTWFAYRAPAKSWVKAGTKAAALKKSRVAVVRPAHGAWQYQLRGLRKGILVVKVSARDNVGNTSRPAYYSQRLRHL